MSGLDPTDAGALRLLQNALRKEMNELADRLAGGEPADYAKYQRLVGIIEGLATAERYLLDIVERQEKRNS